jgi:hypothetical protein
VPAAAVIPALIAYIKVVVVKTPVVDFSTVKVGSPYGFNCPFTSEFEFSVDALYRVSAVT